jgi:peptidoglycan/LPS O-acetylase OafA/YrhL
MNADLVSHHRGRSVAAVATGFFATALLSLGTDVVLHAAGVFPPWGQAMSDGLYVLATIYRVVYTLLGGYLTAALAPRRPMPHVVTLGAIGLVAATIGAAATWNAGPAFGPKWYPLLLVVTALPCVWAGGMLRARRVSHSMN